MNSLRSQLDEAILSVAVTSWKKVAQVIAEAERIMAEKTLINKLPEGEAGLNRVAERIEALIQDGRLIARGDVKKWRYSEVRKPDAGV